MTSVMTSPTVLVTTTVVGEGIETVVLPNTVLDMLFREPVWEDIDIIVVELETELIDLGLADDGSVEDIIDEETTDDGRTGDASADDIEEVVTTEDDELGAAEDGIMEAF